MDAHLFSRFCEELAPRIIGGWLEKVQEPAPGLLAFNINLAARGQSYGQTGGSRKCQLCLRAARKEPFLFLSRSRLAAGRAPSAPVMRLRKYLAGHRILATVCCFSRRQLWLLVGGEAAAEEALRRQMVLWSPAEGEEDGLSPESGAQPDMADMTPESGEAAEREPLATWLLLDLREGASVRFLPVSRSPQEESLRWPEPGELEEALAHWRDWPVLTPALRRAPAVANYGTIFVTLADADKERALPLIKRFYDLGFNIEATKGTCEFLRSHGIRTRHLRKLSEGCTEIYDSLRKGHVTYVINTIDVNQHSTRRDGYDIRRAAAENNVTLFTALETVSVLLDVLEEITLGVSTIDAE